MRFKFYLRGCGLGILFTTIVLMIGFHRAAKPKMSDVEVMQRAAELGMVKAEAAKKDSEDSRQPLDTQQMTEPEDTESQQSQQSEPDVINPNPPESVEHGDGSVELTVKDGDVCRDIAAELYRTKIVKDAEEFRQFMGDNGYSSQIRNGTYIFTPGMEYQEIADLLTTKR